MSRNLQISVVIPTYNEAENITDLLTSLKSSFEKEGIKDFEIIVVDDNSPDGTWKIVEKISKQDSRIRLIRRINERGLASAVLRGIKEARAPYVLIMDADFQHPPEIAPKLVKIAFEKNADVVVASRYVKGGGVEGWSKLRLFISRFATFLAYAAVKESRCTTDPLSGFFVVRKAFVDGRELKPRGYKILLEIIARKPPWKPKVTDVPYIFRDRRKGKSKLGTNTILDYLLHLLDLSTIAKFAIVGFFGTFVNLGVMDLVMKLSDSYDLGSVMGIEVSIIFNFILNDIWTFTKKLKGKVLARLVGYHGSSLGSAITTYVTMKLLHVFFGVSPLLGQLIGILAGFAVNYLLSSKVIWRW